MLSKRELESRYEVWIEQYWIRANIEAETTFSIAKTMILPAALRHLALIGESGCLGDRGRGRAAWSTSWSPRWPSWRRPTPTRTTSRAWTWRSTPATSSSPRWTSVREAADKLEKVVADDLWPLPKYEEMLFIK